MSVHDPHEIPGSFKERATRFVKAFRDTDEADVTVSSGVVARIDDGEKYPGVAIAINEDVHGFSSDEARQVADSFERAFAINTEQLAPERMRQLTQDLEHTGVFTLVVSLRAAADKAEEHFEEALKELGSEH